MEQEQVNTSSVLYKKYPPRLHRQKDKLMSLLLCNKEDYLKFVGKRKNCPKSGQKRFSAEKMALQLQVHLMLLLIICEVIAKGSNEIHVHGFFPPSLHIVFECCLRM